METIKSVSDRMIELMSKGCKDSHTIGAEFEHFIVDRKTMRSYNYYEPEGIREVLLKLKSRGWQSPDSEDSLMYLEKPGATITLEPGGQIELSLMPVQSIQALEVAYCDFVRDIKSALGPDQALVSTGFHPMSSIEDIPFIPKKRYEAMSAYFNTRGQYAHHMMKGTASTQVGIDYSSEEDCGKKLRTFTVLAPLLAAYFDSCVNFEGQIYQGHALRSKIWRETDIQRSLAPSCVFQSPFTFEGYAQYVLSVPPILIQKGHKSFETGTMKMSEIIDKLPEAFEGDSIPQNVVEHLMTMVFPDVRLKHFLEVRMADALPFPCNFAVLELVYAIAYNPILLEDLYQWSLTIDAQKLEEIRVATIIQGLQAPLFSESVGMFLLRLVDRIIMENPELKSLSHYHQIIKNNPRGYSHYLKGLTRDQLCQEIEVKL